jgi:hypothetical protein
MTRIYIDTNVFLAFYQCADGRMGIFQELFARADCIVVPEQTVREFRRNRAAILRDSAKRVRESANINIHTTAIVREMPAFTEWEAARDVAKKHAEAIETQLRNWAKDETSDPVYQQFEKLYVHGTTMSTPAGALAKAHQRKLLGDPPTSPGKYTVGDEIIWETLLALCNDDLIVVSRDRTFLDNESILRTEFELERNRRLLLVTKSLSAALKLVDKPSKEISEAETAIKQEQATGRAGACNCPEGSDPSGWMPNGRFLMVYCKRCHKVLASQEDPEVND